MRQTPLKESLADFQHRLLQGETAKSTEVRCAALTLCWARRRDAFQKQCAQLRGRRNECYLAVINLSGAWKDSPVSRSRAAVELRAAAACRGRSPEKSVALRHPKYFHTCIDAHTRRDETWVAEVSDQTHVSPVRPVRRVPLIHRQGTEVVVVRVRGIGFGVIGR